jgi:hypothetical protein
MIHRIALFIASLAAVAVLVVGLSMAGLGQGTPAAVDAAPSVVPAVAATDAAPTQQVQVDTVYLAPPVTAPVVVVHKTVPAPAGESESESEGAGD